MILIRISGHSGAGKSRLVAALPHYGLDFRRAILYTSRAPREGEIHGRDYYFLSRSAIKNLPRSSFFIGQARGLLQALDLRQMEEDLRANRVVIVEIFAGLWPGLLKALRQRVVPVPRIFSVFMTAVDPQKLRSLSMNEKARIIYEEVRTILVDRGKDSPDEIEVRASSAAKEILTALRDRQMYDLILNSAPEGPDGQDDWTRKRLAVANAKRTIEEFLRHVHENIRFVK